MAIKTITYVPDMNHSTISSPIKLSQGDTSFEIVFDLSSYSNLENIASARLGGYQ